MDRASAWHALGMHWMRIVRTWLHCLQMSWWATVAICHRKWPPRTALPTPRNCPLQPHLRPQFRAHMIPSFLPRAQERPEGAPNRTAQPQSATSKHDEVYGHTFFCFFFSF